MDGGDVCTLILRGGGREVRSSRSSYLHCEFGGQEEKRKEERMGGGGDSFTYEGNRAIPGSWLISVASPGTEFQSYRGRFLGSNGQPEIYRTGIPAKEGWLVR